MHSKQRLEHFSAWVAIVAAAMAMAAPGARAQAASDYVSGGYEIGHMPAFDRSRMPESSFSLSNATPQSKDIGAAAMNEREERARAMTATNLQMGIPTAILTKSERLRALMSTNAQMGAPIVRPKADAKSSVGVVGAPTVGTTRRHAPPSPEYSSRANEVMGPHPMAKLAGAEPQGGDSARVEIPTLASKPLSESERGLGAKLATHRKASIPDQQTRMSSTKTRM